MADSQSHRPPAVMTAVVLVVIAGLILIVSAYDSINTLHSVDRREAVTQAMAMFRTPTGAVKIDEILLVMRACWLTMAATAAAAVVMAPYLLKRHRGARVALLVAAAVALLLMLPTGGYAALPLAMGAGMLWSKPVRAWFDGVSPRARS